MPKDNSFLGEVAAKLYEQGGEHLQKLTVVCPNKRTGQAFEQCLVAQTTKSIWAPKICTLATLIAEFTRLSIAPPLTLIWKLYQTLQAINPTKESFERFYPWGVMLLQDFDVLDKYLIQADQLFANLLEQKVLERTYEHLTEAQKDAIRSFWQSFDQQHSQHQQDFLQRWKLLPQVYKQFQQHLLAQKMAYEGLCYRTVCNDLEQGRLVLHHQKLVFVGFNALHPAEEKLLAWFTRQVSTDFYWDFDAYYMEDERQEAGHYLRAHQNKSYFQQSFTRPFPARIQHTAKHIQLFAVAAEVGQAQVISTQLQALMQAQGTRFRPHKTVLVLANETLFLPLMHALPDQVRPVSTTFGYPLYHTHIYQLLRSLLDLRLATSKPTCPPGYLPTPAVIPILSNPHVRSYDRTLSEATIDHLQRRHVMHTAQAALMAHNGLYEVLFRSLSATDNLLQYLLEVLTLLATYFQKVENTIHFTEKAAWKQLYQQLTELQQATQPLAKPALQDFILLFQHLAAASQCSLYEGNLTGLQILPVWETRNLDFDNVFILGMNEGVFPNNQAQHSLIPYNLRKGYGLPTADTFQASLNAYYFYRLLQRAQNVYITYTTHTLTKQPGEMSRYLWQLIYEAQLPIERHWVAPTIQINTISPIHIQKDATIRQILDKFIVQPGQQPEPLTPTALNTYLDCSLQFYFRYIAQLRPATPTQENFDAVLFGKVFHRVMETLYKPLVQSKSGLSIQPQDFKALLPKVADVVQTTWIRSFPQGQQASGPLVGKYVVAQKAMTNIVHKMIEVDQNYAPFELIGLELGRDDDMLCLDFELNRGKYVRLRGIIDRVDRKGGLIRVLDYKTGIHDQRIASIVALFDRHTPKRNYVAFQTLFYAWLFKQCQLADGDKILPGIISTRLIFSTSFDPHFSIKQKNSQAYTSLEDITAYQSNFETLLRSLLEEILTPTIPFTQTEDLTQCTVCPYQGICQRY